VTRTTADPQNDAAIRVSLVSLGCAKNLVDSEVIVGRLAQGPFALQRDPEGSDVVIVNTCGFIDAAKDESIDTICEMLELKARGEVKGVVVAGCMVRRYGEVMQRELPDVDAFLDISDYSDAPALLARIRDRGVLAESPARAQAGPPILRGGDKTSTVDLGRTLLTASHSAYLRISEGCDRKCAFCAIPLIRGTQRSKPIEVLLREARDLAARGVKELSLIGEETTAYGSDIGMKYGLGIVDLLRALRDVDGLRWIRLQYAHPGSFRRELIEEIRDNDKVAKYVDVPIQHGDDDILKKMKRGTPRAKILELMRELREEIPGITLRTTILVGFPHETERRFENLLELLREVRFDRLGCFAYSREEGTSSHDLGSRVPARVAAERRRKVMTLQRRIARDRSKRLLGTEVEVLVDAVAGDQAIGRTEGDAPQVDGVVRFATGGARIAPGAFVRVAVERIDGYDLIGKRVETAPSRRAKAAR
jgi:ribosomal protein S12 methylthiotransferase